MTSSVDAINADNIGVGIEDVFSADGTAVASIVAPNCNGSVGLSGSYALTGHQINEGVDSIWTWIKDNNTLIVHIAVNADITVTLRDPFRVYYQETRSLVAMGNWSQADDPALAFNGDVSGIVGCSPNSAQVSM